MFYDHLIFGVQEVRERMFYEDKINFTSGVIDTGKAGGLSLLSE